MYVYILEDGFVIVRHLQSPETIYSAFDELFFKVSTYFKFLCSYSSDPSNIERQSKYT